MRDSEKGVGRADHNPQDGQVSESGTGASFGTADDSADQRAHGTHGRGRGEERLNDAPPIDPTISDVGDARGSGSWGSEGSGGSVVDKRSDKK
jgi:hypothetical protein